MEMLRRMTILMLAVGLMISCDNKDSDLAEPDFFVFGHFYGFCHGEECIEIFKIENERLYEDSNDNYPRSDEFYEGNYELLTEDQYELVSDLPMEFPTDLFEEEERVIGLPDAGDWGGLYIEYKKGEVHQFWILDQNNTYLPEYLHAFRDQVNDAIESINQN